MTKDKDKDKEERTINLLDLIPVRKIEWKKKEEGLVELLKPKFKRPFLKKYLLPYVKRPHYRIKLDAVGSFIWGLSDGNLSVKEIAKSLKAEFGDKVEPLYDRLALFLQSLEKNGFIEFKGK